MRRAEKETRSASQQKKDEFRYMADKGLVPLPFNYSGLLTLMDNCSYFDACVRQIARDVAGQGWELVLRDGETEDDAARVRIEEFLSDPNTAEDSVDDVIERLIIDWGLVGMFCLEVVRAKPGNAEPAVAGRVNGLYHVPAHTVRAHKDGNKFCQIQGQKYTWFKRFGYDREVDANTGDERVPGAAAPVGGTAFVRANEIIVYVNYYPQSAFYGAPQILPAVGAVKALIGIRDYNLAFFENYGVPAAIVTVEGDWDDETVKEISDFIDVEIKGSNNQHKTIVVNPPEGGKITWSPLIVEVKEGSFKLYFKQLRDEVLVCYRMPPYRIGIEETGSLGGNVASEATRIYIDSTVNPLKRVVNHILSEKIVRGGFDCGLYEFELGELDIRDMTTLTSRALQLFGVGAMNRNEVRELLGMELLDPKKDKTAEAYFISAAYKEIGAESAEAAAGEQMAMVDGALKGLRSDVEKALEESRRGRRPDPLPE
jgi:PBSX family phage portal protein